MSQDLAIAAPVARPEPLAAHLHALPRGDGSPFARLPGTHFARFTVVPLGRRGPHLLFLARHDGERAPYLLALARETAEAWAHCRAAPAPAALPAWLATKAVKPAYVISAWPDESVQDVRDALDLQRRLEEFALRAPRDPVGLAHAFRTELRP